MKACKSHNIIRYSKLYFIPTIVRYTPVYSDDIIRVPLPYIYNISHIFRSCATTIGVYHTITTKNYTTSLCFNIGTIEYSEQIQSVNRCNNDDTTILVMIYAIPGSQLVDISYI